jgi:tetratricopeptide (TPR) repeat protein
MIDPMGALRGRLMKLFVCSLATFLLAGAALAAAPVVARDAKPPKAEAPKPPKLSKPYAVGLSAAQNQMQAGDNTGALVTLNGLGAVPPVEPDDAYTTMLMKLNAAIGLKDNLLTENMLQALLDTGRVSADNQRKFLLNIGALAMGRMDYNAATIAFEKVVAIDPSDTNTIAGLAEVYFIQALYEKAVETINNAIAVYEVMGNVAPVAFYRRSLAMAYSKNYFAALPPAALAMVAAYPSPENWNDALIVTSASFPNLDPQTKLDFQSLQNIAGSPNRERSLVISESATGSHPVDQAAVQLRFGMSLAKLGDKAGATKAFLAVSGGAREALAKLWLVYLNPSVYPNSRALAHLALPTARGEQKNAYIAEAKRKCVDLGFVSGTPKFGQCVLKVSE